VGLGVIAVRRSLEVLLYRTAGRYCRAADLGLVYALLVIALGIYIGLFRNSSRKPLRLRQFDAPH
jgi:hypothetical protein